MTDAREILIVEDQPDTRALVATRVAKTYPHAHVYAASTLGEARECISQTPPDIVLVDLELPDGSGTSLLREVAYAHPTCFRIVITVFADDRHLLPALKAGAQGYLLKDLPEEQFMVALAGVLDGNTPLSPQIARRILNFFATPSGSIYFDLSPRETEALKLATRGYSLAEIANCMHISPNTAATHIKNIYRKMEVSTRAEATMVAMQYGLLG